MIPTAYKTDYAKRKGAVPFPCFYCQHYNGKAVCDSKNIVLNFGTEANVPNTCNAVLSAPTDYADCKHIYLTELPGSDRRTYPTEVFSFFTKEYLMEIICYISSVGYAKHKDVVSRSNKGYHTRELRIQELLNDGIIDKFLNNGEPVYSLTDYGQNIADALSELFDRFTIIKEHGELMNYTIPKEVFEYVRSNARCTAKQIYSYFDRHSDYDETDVPLSLEYLVHAGYVQPSFTKDYSQIEYTVTHKGITRWRKIYADAEVS